MFSSNKGSVAVQPTTGSGKNSNPLLTAPGKTWFDTDLLNGLAGFAPEHCTWLVPDNGAEHRLFLSCLRGVKELGKFGLLDAIATDPRKIADILSDHKGIQKTMVEFLWKKCAIKSSRVFIGIKPDDPLAPVMKEMVTEARLLKACKAQLTSGVPKIPVFEVHFERTAQRPAALAKNTPSPALLSPAGVTDKTKV